MTAAGSVPFGSGWRVHQQTSPPRRLKRRDESDMDTKARLEKLADLAQYAASKKLIVTRVHHGAPDGELTDVGIANFPDPDGSEDRVRRTIAFGHTHPASATYREEFPVSDGGRKAIVNTIPYDFSESYRIADIWKGGRGGEDHAWQEFEDAESLIDFLADRLTASL